MAHRVATVGWQCVPVCKAQPVRVVCHIIHLLWVLHAGSPITQAAIQSVPSARDGPFFRPVLSNGRLHCAFFGSAAQRLRPRSVLGRAAPNGATAGARRNCADLLRQLGRAKPAAAHGRPQIRWRRPPLPAQQPRVCALRFGTLPRSGGGSTRPPPIAARCRSQAEHRAAGHPLAGCTPARCTAGGSGGA